MIKSPFSCTIDILKKSFKVLAIFIIFMSIARVYLYLHHSIKTVPFNELFNALFLGFRLDLSILGYIFTPILLFIIFINILKSKFIIKSYSIVKTYLMVMLTIASILIFAYIVYFSYFY